MNYFVAFGVIIALNSIRMVAFNIQNLQEKGGQDDS
jgi:hypothetical protein